MTVMNGEGISQRQAAVTAGLALLVMSVAAMFAYGFVYGSLIVPGNAEATVSNLGKGLTLFRVGLAAWMIILVADIVVAWALYLYFARVDKAVSLLCGWLRLSYAGILGIAIAGLTVAGIAVSKGGSGSQLPAAELNSLVMLCIDVFNSVWSTGLIVFGLHLLILGLLALKADFVPRIIGILIVIAAVSYFSLNSLKLVIPQFQNLLAVLENVLTIPMMAEIVLAVWLLLRGGKQA
ncbi:MAG: DUF4386 domain-containing protein [Spirochaetaceae bacterium]|nr:DUF4386 domain-containing protein [Spirochaetaceae bacterium]MCF7947953.1 DUF4386 domain-containing protein [Spirochaetia bacterium]MCF7951262.1 DUF4386 domain-containing protein [Spirochaetaceae bacterium]